jgi:hypothetical protein
MSRPKGSRNKLTVERENSARWLVEKFGDPVENILRRRNQLIEEREELLALRAELLAAPSRHLRHQKIAKAEAKINLLDEKILKHNEASANYVRPRFQAITTADVTPRVTVVRAPDTVSDTKAWLAAHAPQRDNAVNDRPVLPFVKKLRTALDVADELGINDTNEIVNEARKQTDDEATPAETEIDRLRKGNLW